MSLRSDNTLLKKEMSGKVTTLFMLENGLLISEIDNFNIYFKLETLSFHGLFQIVSHIPSLSIQYLKGIVQSHLFV